MFFKYDVNNIVYKINVSTKITSIITPLILFVLCYRPCYGLYVISHVPQYQSTILFRKIATLHTPTSTPLWSNNSSLASDLKDRTLLETADYSIHNSCCVRCSLASWIDLTTSRYPSLCLWCLLQYIFYSQFSPTTIRCFSIALVLNKLQLNNIMCITSSSTPKTTSFSMALLNACKMTCLLNSILLCNVHNKLYNY